MRILKNSFIRFLITGGSAAILEYALFAVLSLASVGVLIANSLSFATGAIVSFLLNRRWVFASEGKIHRQFVAYVTLALINLFISNGIVFTLTEPFGISPLIAKFVSMAMIASANYFIFSRFIFKTAG